MDRKQLTVLWLAIAIIVAMCLYPPWMGSRGRTDTTAYGLRGPAGYHAIWVNTRHLRHNYYGFRKFNVDLHRLVIQIAPVALVAGGLIITFRRR